MTCLCNIHFVQIKFVNGLRSESRYILGCVWLTLFGNKQVEQPGPSVLSFWYCLLLTVAVVHRILVWFQCAVFERNIALVVESNLIFICWFTTQIVSVLRHSRLSKIWDSNILMEFIFSLEIHLNHPTPHRLGKDNCNFFSRRLVDLCSLHPLFMSQWCAHCYLDVNVNEHAWFLKWL